MAAPSLRSELFKGFSISHENCLSVFQILPVFPRYSSFQDKACNLILINEHMSHTCINSGKLLNVKTFNWKDTTISRDPFSYIGDTNHAPKNSWGKHSPTVQNREIRERFHLRKFSAIRPCTLNINILLGQTQRSGGSLCLAKQNIYPNPRA